jgi:hypothetical protein
MKKVSLIASLSLNSFRRKSLANSARSLRVERLEERHMLAGLVVTSLADNMTTDGLITLREALVAANNDAVADTMVPSQVGSGTDVISFSPSLFSGGPVAMVLTQGQLVIASNLTLQGPGAGLLAIDASGSDGSRVIDVNDGNNSNYAAVEIFGITITGGNLMGSSYAEGVGGGIRNLEHLSLWDSVVSGNAASGEFGSGGGVSDSYFGGPSGTTEIVRSRISGNTARFGGGVYVGATTTIRESTIQNNIASDGGGGVSKNAGTLSIIDSTISGNTAGEGGGLYTRYGATTVTNSTISGNTATFEGGGIRAPLRANSAKLFVSHSTIVNNTAMQDSGGGISLNVDNDASGGEASISHSIIAGNHDQAGVAPDLDRTINPSLVSLTTVFSLIGKNAGSGLLEAQTADSNGNLIGGSGSSAIDPLLTELGDYGGPTHTHRINAGSPALNAGNPAFLPGLDGVAISDQRGAGYPRILAGIIDIGAVETAVLPGDYNFDAVVDHRDHMFWTQRFSAIAGTGLEADGNRDWVVDSADYVVWRKFFGTYADDHGNTTAMSTQVLVPSTTWGTLHNAADVDTFRFSATSGLSYVFDTVLLGLASSGLRLIDTDGSTVLQQDTNGGAAQIIWTAPQTGTYYLEVTGVSGGAGTYQLTTSRDEANTAALAELVETFSNTTATIFQPGDVDWFRFNLFAAGTATVSTGLGTLSGSALRVYAGDGTTLIGSDVDGGTGEVEWAATAGTYFAQVSGLGAATGSYNLEVRLDVPDDHGNSSGAATSVGVPSDTSGMIGVSGDEDWFSFTAQTGVDYVFETVLGTLGDSVLWLYDSDGVTELDFNDDADGLESRIGWTATSNGTFYLAVGGFDSEVGTYTLQVSLGEPDDHGNSPGAATSVSVPSDTLGMIGVTGDEDWFSFTAQTGVDYVFETALGTLGDSVLWLYGSDGVTELDFNDDYFDLESRIEWTAPSNGTFYLAVGGFDSAVGTYQLLLDSISGVGAGVAIESFSESFTDESNYARIPDIDSNRISPSSSLARPENVRVSSTQQDSPRSSSLRPWIDGVVVPTEWANTERVEGDDHPLASLSRESQKKAIDNAFEFWDARTDIKFFGWLAAGA